MVIESNPETLPRYRRLPSHENAVIRNPNSDSVDAIPSDRAYVGGIKLSAGNMYSVQEAFADGPNERWVKVVNRPLLLRCGNLQKRRVVPRAGMRARIVESERVTSRHRVRLPLCSVR